MADLKVHRVVVTGGRKFTDYDRIEADLRALRRHGLRRVAEGQSSGGGADDLAHDAWHLLVNESTERYQVKPIDGRHRGAPMNRNTRMVGTEQRLANDAAEALVVLAYPDATSRGTWHCVAEAVKRGITCVVWCSWITAPGPNDPGAMGVVREGCKRHGVDCPPLFDRGGKRAIVCSKQHAHVEADSLFDVLDGPDALT